MADDDGYHDYLLKRSRLGLLYRTNILYPRIAPYLVGRTLDIGCGIGDMLGFRPGTIGVDINPNNVAYCQRNGYEAHLMEQDRLPFPDASFDSAILDNVLEHIAEPGPLLGEIYRILPADGTLIIGVPGELGYASDDDHKIFYDEHALVTCLAAAGYRTETIIHTPVKSALLNRRMRQYCVYGVFKRT